MSGGYTKPTPVVETKSTSSDKMQHSTIKAIEQVRKQKAKESLDPYKAGRAKYEEQAPKSDPEMDALTTRFISYLNLVVASVTRTITVSGTHPLETRGRELTESDDQGAAFRSQSEFGVNSPASPSTTPTRPDDAAFAYDHQNDPGIYRLATKCGRSGKDRLRRSQTARGASYRQIETMKAQGIKPDPTYLPEKVRLEHGDYPARHAPPAQSSQSRSESLRSATGPKGAVYYEVGDM